MELRHLRYFSSVARFQNFSRAAEDLNIVQSALSRQIRDLENDLGVLLFERLPRGVKLSKAGEAFLVDAHRILDAASRARDRARRTADGLAGTLNIAYIDVCTRSDVMIGAVSAFRREYPDAELRLHNMDSQEQLESLRCDRLDGGFLAHLPSSATWLRSVSVFNGEYGLALPAGHSLAKRDRLRLGDLRDENFIWVSGKANAAMHSGLMEACGVAGFVPRIVQEASGEQAILCLVSAGLGLSFLSLSAARELDKTVVIKRIEDLTVSLTIDLAWSSANSSRMLPRFVDIVRRVRSGAICARAA
jgi:LysR family transcriptional regulator, benzoate and cis,cis-muconate-responsive activator of ben and cat genes